MARGLKFQIEKEEGLYSPFSENKGADQFRGYREADLRLFSHMQKSGFLTTRLIWKLQRFYYQGSRNKGTDQPVQQYIRSVPLFLALARMRFRKDVN